jgi:hypothetical protein
MRSHQVMFSSLVHIGTYQYVLEKNSCTCMYQYIPVHTGTYRYIPVHTILPDPSPVRLGVSVQVYRIPDVISPFPSQLLELTNFESWVSPLPGRKSRLHRLGVAAGQRHEPSEGCFKFSPSPSPAAAAGGRGLQVLALSHWPGPGCPGCRTSEIQFWGSSSSCTARGLLVPHRDKCIK